MTNPFDWSLAAQKVGADGRAFAFAATRERRDEVAKALGFLACRSLRLEGRARALAHGRYLVAGVLSAEVEQACVLTLEPVTQAIVREFAIEFWPKGEVEAGASVSFDALSGEDPEPIEDGRLGLGRLAYELLADELDPYPREAGASLNRHEPPPAATEADGPFALLAKLKPEAERQS